MFKVTKESTGHEFSQHQTVRDAVVAAWLRMEDDPEIGDLAVYDSAGDLARRVCFCPDDDWDTTIRVFLPGEPLVPPSGYVPRRITQEDLDAYPVGDPKRIGLEQLMEQELHA